MKSVYLYCLTSRDDQLKPIHRRLRSRAKRFLGRRICELSDRIGAALWYPDLYVDRVNTNRGDIAIREAIRQLLERAALPLDVVEVTWGDLTTARVDEINRNAGLFLVGGSGYFMCNALGNAPERLERDLEKMTRMNVPIVYHAVGFNLHVSREWGGHATLSERALNVLGGHARLAAILSVRDETTRRLFAGVGTRAVTVVPDPVLFMEPADPPRSRPTGLLLGLNFAIHGGVTRELMTRNFNTYVRCLEWLKREAGATVWYFLHEDSEKIVVQALQRRHLLDRIIDRPPSEMLADYGLLDVHICQMMHSSIMAFNRAVPAICLAYDIKNRGFYQLMQREDLLLAAGTLDLVQLRQAISRTLSNRDQLRAELTERKKALWTLEKTFLDAVGDLVRETGRAA